MPDKKPVDKPKLLEGQPRIAVQTLMPISLIWHDFLAKNEYIDENAIHNFSVQSLVELVRSTTEYIANVYQQLGVTQEQFDEIANIVSPMLYPPTEDEPPHPDKNGDSAPNPVKV